MLDVSPLAAGILATTALAVIVAVLACLAVAVARRRVATVAPLPSGADAALWSIVEAVPDPRNHLALTRDLSGEVHITTADRDAMAALYADEAKVERLDRTPRNPSGVDLRETASASAPAPAKADTTPESLASEGREDLTLTGQLFFAGHPQLNRF